jgi:hypothetical protein
LALPDTLQAPEIRRGGVEPFFRKIPPSELVFGTRPLTSCDNLYPDAVGSYTCFHQLDRHMKKSQPSSPNTDYFDTYLGEVRGRTAIEQVVERVKQTPRTVGELAQELSFTPEDIASAVGNAAKFGLVRLESKGDDTVVMPAGPPA